MPFIHWGSARFLWTLKLGSSSLLVFPLRFLKIRMHRDEKLYRQAYFLLLLKGFGLGVSWLPNIEFFGSGPCLLYVKCIFVLNTVSALGHVYQMLSFERNRGCY